MSWKKLKTVCILTAANVDVLNTSAMNDEYSEITVNANITVELPLSETYITGEN